MTSLEDRLVCRLLTDLLILMSSDPNPGSKHPTIPYTLSQSYFKYAKYTFVELGIAKPQGTQTQSDNIFVTLDVLVSPEVLPEHLENMKAEAVKLLPVVLNAFICVTIHHESMLSEQREPFTPPNELNAAIELLTEAGYCEKTDIGFAWTDKIGPLMVEISLWHENFTAYANAVQEMFDLDRNAREAWKTMPAEVRSRTLEMEPIGKANLVKSFKDDWSWDDGEWQLHGQANNSLYRAYELADRTISIEMKRRRNPK